MAILNVSNHKIPLSKYIKFYFVARIGIDFQNFTLFFILSIFWRNYKFSVTIIIRMHLNIFRGVTHLFRALICLLQNQLTLRMKMLFWQFLEFLFTIVTLLQVILTMVLKYDEQELPANASSISPSFFFKSFLHAAQNRLRDDMKKATQKAYAGTQLQKVQEKWMNEFYNLKDDFEIDTDNCKMKKRTNFTIWTTTLNSIQLFPRIPK